MMPKLVASGMLVAGDAAGFCLATGLYIEGINYAMQSGFAAGEAAIKAHRLRDFTRAHAQSLHRVVLALQRVHRFPRLPPRAALRQRRAAAESLSGDAGARLRTAVPGGRQRQAEARAAVLSDAPPVRLKPRHLLQRPLSRGEELPMVMTTHEEKMRTAGSRSTIQPHIVVDRREMQNLFGQRLRHRVSGQPFRPARRRQRSVQLRTMLRVRYVLLRLRKEGAMRWTYPRRRLRRDLPQVVRPGALSSASPPRFVRATGRS